MAEYLGSCLHCQARAGDPCDDSCDPRFCQNCAWKLERERAKLIDMANVARLEGQHGVADVIVSRLKDEAA
jgi:hypothetical protein